MVFDPETYRDTATCEKRLNLRVQGVDFEWGEVLIRHGKGGRPAHGVALLATGDLQARLGRRKKRHERNLQRDGGMLLPNAMDRKAPGSSEERPTRFYTLEGVVR